MGKKGKARRGGRGASAVADLEALALLHTQFDALVGGRQVDRVYEAHGSYDSAREALCAATGAMGIGSEMHIDDRHSDDAGGDALAAPGAEVTVRGGGGSLGSPNSAPPGLSMAGSVTVLEGEGEVESEGEWVEAAPAARRGASPRAASAASVSAVLPPPAPRPPRPASGGAGARSRSRSRNRGKHSRSPRSGGGTPVGDGRASPGSGARSPPGFAPGAASAASEAPGADEPHRGGDSLVLALSTLVDLFGDSFAEDDIKVLLTAADGDVVKATDLVLEQIMREAVDVDDSGDDSEAEYEAAATFVPVPGLIPGLPPEDRSRGRRASRRARGGRARGSGPAEQVPRAATDAATVEEAAAAGLAPTPVDAPRPASGGGKWRVEALQRLQSQLEATVEPSVVEAVVAAHRGDVAGATAALESMFPDEIATARLLAKIEREDDAARLAKANAEAAAAAAAAPAASAAPRGGAGGTAGAGPSWAASSAFLQQWLPEGHARRQAPSAAEAAASAAAADDRMRDYFRRAALASRAGGHGAMAAGEYARQARELRAMRQSARLEAAVDVFARHNPDLKRADFGPGRAKLPYVDCHGLTVEQTLLLVRQLVRHAVSVSVPRLTIITGMGLHSRGGPSKARLRPAVERLLSSAGVPFTYDEGVFRVTVNPDRTRM